MTIIVDNSIVEVHINDRFSITSRVYPWLGASVGAGFIQHGGTSNAKVRFSNVELWDGLSAYSGVVFHFEVER
jgi:beta-fructofuranosidase